MRTQETISVTVTNGEQTSWSISSTNEGYISVLYGIRHGYAGNVNLDVESSSLGNNTATVSGYGRIVGGTGTSYTINVTAIFLWYKNI